MRSYASCFDAKTRDMKLASMKIEGRFEAMFCWSQTVRKVRPKMQCRTNIPAVAEEKETGWFWSIIFRVKRGSSQKCLHAEQPFKRTSRSWWSRNVSLQVVHFLLGSQRFCDCGLELILHNWLEGGVSPTAAEYCRECGRTAWVTMNWFSSWSRK